MNSIKTTTISMKDHAGWRAEYTVFGDVAFNPDIYITMIEDSSGIRFDLKASQLIEVARWVEGELSGGGNAQD